MVKRVCANCLPAGANFSLAGKGTCDSCGKNSILYVVNISRSVLAFLFGNKKEF